MINGIPIHSPQLSAVLQLAGSAAEAGAIIAEEIESSVAEVPDPTYNGIESADGACQEMVEMYRECYPKTTLFLPSLLSRLQYPPAKNTPAFGDGEKFYLGLQPAEPAQAQWPIYDGFSVDEFKADPIDIRRILAFLETASRDKKCRKHGLQYYLVKAYYPFLGALLMLPDQLMPEFDAEDAGDIFMETQGAFFEQPYKISIDSMGTKFNPLALVRHELTHALLVMRRALLGDIIGIRPDVAARMLVYLPSLTEENIHHGNEAIHRKKWEGWCQKSYSSMKRFNSEMPQDLREALARIDKDLGRLFEEMEFFGPARIKAEYAAHFPEDVFEQRFFPKIEDLFFDIYESRPDEDGENTIMDENVPTPLHLAYWHQILLSPADAKTLSELPADAATRRSMAERFGIAARKRKAELLNGGLRRIGEALFERYDVASQLNSADFAKMVLQYEDAESDPSRLIENCPALSVYSPETLSRLEALLRKKAR